VPPLLSNESQLSIIKKITGSLCWVRTLNRAVLRIWVTHSAPTWLRMLIPRTSPFFILTMYVEGTLPSVKILPQGSSFFRNLTHNVPPLLRNSISTAVHFEVYFYRSFTGQGPQTGAWSCAQLVPCAGPLFPEWPYSGPYPRHSIVANGCT